MRLDLLEVRDLPQSPPSHSDLSAAVFPEPPSPAADLLVISPKAHGGMYLDHDSFVLRPLDPVRCTNARPLLAGLEVFGPSTRKLNNAG